MNALLIINLITVAFAQKFTLPPIRQISHDIQSGPIEILDNNTIIIPKFYFDGKAPRAHFWVGRGQPSTNGTLVPHPTDTGTLPMFANANITLKLPNITINDIEYISVWCEAVEESLGHVFTNERWVRGRNGTGMILPKTIGPFRRTKHGVSSGNIVLVDQRSVFVPNFNYDGTDTAAHFWVGTNSHPFNGKLTRVAAAGLTLSSKYYNTNVTVILPENTTVTDFDYLAVWDSRNSSFGIVDFNDTSDDMDMYIGQEYEGFENKEYGLRTGPIIVANRNTIYIANFRYRGFDNEFFWAGSEQRPDEKGSIVHNQVGLEDNIQQDNGSSFYVTLPSWLPENEKKYFGIWDNRTRALLVKISFANVGKDVPAKITEDGKRIIRYPKCCPHKKMMHDTGCISTDMILDNSIPVHYANSTHLNDEPMVPDRIMYVPYLNNLSCPRYFLDPKLEEDKFLYLTSGTLLFPGNRAHHNQDEFCLDLIEEDNETVRHVAFICHESHSVEEGLRIAICICVFLSAVCLLFTAATFFVVTDREDMRGASIAGFAGFMGIAFICLFFTQVGIGSQTLCNVLGFIFQFFIVSSLIWLDALCYEMYYNIRYFYDESILGTYKKRITWYSVLALVFPLVFVIISLSFSIPVGLINVNLDKHCFLSVSNKKWLLYSPILLTVLIAIGLTVYNYQLYYRTQNEMNRTEGRTKFFWKSTKSDIKTRLMLCVFLVAFTSLCWIFEIITYAFESSWEPLDILHALQGVFTMIIVLSTGKIWKKLTNRMCRRKSRPPTTAMTELQPMNNNAAANP